MSRSRLAVRLRLALVSTLITLVLVELLFRLFEPANVGDYRGGTFYTETGRQVPLGEIVHFITRNDEYEARVLAERSGPSGGIRKNLKLRQGYDPPAPWDYFDENGCISVGTNSLGFRDLEFAVEKQPREFRVLAFGDSFTYGQGVRLDLTWPQVLEQRLRTALARPCEVINCGFAVGYLIRNPDGYDRWLQSDGLRFQPDLVLVGICLNDMGDAVPMASYAAIPRTPVLGGFSHLLNYIVQGLRQRAERNQKRDLTRVVTDNPAQWQGTQRGLLAMRDQLQAANVPFVVVVFPMLSQLDDYPYRGLHGLLGEFCRANAIRCLDLLPLFEGKDELQYWVHPCDQHPNHIGHAIYAQAIDEYLVREGLRPK
ncbi:MAG: SGNH/GDSL hydrolase family protein [Planctomycetes bacterium]|nr:SGNH/GDSL hydrolase family protein [Planctomycetota bacterium]